jgi:benzoylformate decarboxylase
MTTVRDATVEVWRQLGLRKIFANPGSTEIALLASLPDDFELVLGLHEGSVVGIATGYAIARGEPALVVLHTAAGFGNAVGALATARVNRAALVVIVGQQDRRHLAFEPFLAGRLEGLAGSYAVWQQQPVRAEDVPGAIARAWFEARDGRGPAIVVVPMDDWQARVSDDAPVPAPGALLRSEAVDVEVISALAAMLGDADRPCLVVGAGADSDATWTAIEALAERLDCPVWQEAFGARAGFPQDHPRFAGHLPSRRAELRKTLARHDVVLVIGAPVFRQYPYDSGPLVEPTTRIALITAESDEARRSPAELAIHAVPAAALTRLLEVLPGAQRTPQPRLTPQRHARPSLGEPLRPAHVFAVLGELLPVDTVLVEETPSSRAELHALIPARRPLGFLSAAAGGLGFGLSAAIGVKMASPERPVVAAVGDGSAMYAIQALWSAAHYHVGVLFITLSNGSYAIMDQLAAEAGDTAPPWPAFEEISICGLAANLGCASQRIETHEDFRGRIEEVVPSLSTRSEPLVLDVAVAADLDLPPRPDNDRLIKEK